MVKSKSKSRRAREQESMGSGCKGAQSRCSWVSRVECRGMGLRWESQSQSRQQSQQQQQSQSGTGQAWVGDLSGAVCLLSHYVVLRSVDCGLWIVDTLFEQKTETYVLNKQFKTTGFRRLEKIIEFCRISTFSSGLFWDRWSERLRPAFNEPI